MPFFCLNGQMWLMIKLSPELFTSKGQRFWHDDQIKHLSGQRILWLIFTRGTEVTLYLRPVLWSKVGLLPTFPLFSPKSSKLKSAIYSEKKNFCWALKYCLIRREKNYFLKIMRTWLIYLHLHILFENRQIEQPNINISCLPQDLSLKRSGSRPWWILPWAKKRHLESKNAITKHSPRL